MSGDARNSDEKREAANHDDNDEATSNVTTTEERRRSDETFGEEQGGGDSSKLGEEGVEATPSAGSSKRVPTKLLFNKVLFVGNCGPVRPGKDGNQPRAKNDDTLDISNINSPRRIEVAKC